MAALTQARSPNERFRTIKTYSWPLAAQHVYPGGCAGYDTAALGSIKKAAALATFIPLGEFMEEMDNSAGAAGALSVLVELQHEIRCYWFENSGNITLASNLFGIAYFTDDHTVTATVGTNGPAGRIMDVSANKGVLVHFVGSTAVV